MNKTFSFTTVLALAAALTLTGCGAGANSTTPGQEPSALSTGTATSATTSGAASMESMIHIQDGTFINPTPLAAGSTVTVMNMDAEDRTVVSADSSFSVSVPAGGMATFAAPKKPGNYPFHAVGTDLRGVLTVTASAPSAAATMVCADEAKQTVKEILGLPAAPTTTDAWDGTTYSCTYPLDVGSFVMTVTESANNADAATVAKQLAGSLQAAPIEGLANLGLPGYQAKDGNVVFAKDNMTLHVDATAFPATVGPHTVTASSFAYEMATTILGCWTAHHG
ncbi:cupredoxin domain-containing protein [Arthrobacter sp. HLT1-20]